jgi:hypothetical protein
MMPRVQGFPKRGQDSTTLVPRTNLNHVRSPRSRFQAASQARKEVLALACSCPCLLPYSCPCNFLALTQPLYAPACPPAPTQRESMQEAALSAWIEQWKHRQQPAVVSLLSPLARERAGRGAKHASVDVGGARRGSGEAATSAQQRPPPRSHTVIGLCRERSQHNAQEHTKRMGGRGGGSGIEAPTELKAGVDVGKVSSKAAPRSSQLSPARVQRRVSTSTSLSLPPPPSIPNT